MREKEKKEGGGKRENTNGEVKREQEWGAKVREEGQIEGEVGRDGRAMGRGEVRKGERESKTITKNPAAAALAWVLDDSDVLIVFYFLFFQFCFSQLVDELLQRLHLGRIHQIEFQL